MKKYFVLLSILFLAMTMNAQNKTLVAYFSATGTTKKVAEQIAKDQKADLFEIKPTVAYTAADLDWRDKQSRSSVEMNDKSSRPEMAGKVEKMDQYSVVYIGFPIWWYVAPHIINTFIESHKLEGKTIIPFATSGGSGIEGSVKELRATYPSLKFENGKLY